MDILIKKEDKQVNVFVTGRIDSFTCKEMYAEVIKNISEDTNLLFDFRDVEYISSLGIKTLLSLKKKVSKGSFKIINAADNAYRTFIVTGFDSLIDISPMTEDLYTYISCSFKKLLKIKEYYFPDFVFLKDSIQSYTYTEIEKITQIIAKDLTEKGVKSGTHVGIFGGNSINWVLTFFALQKIGAIACLINSTYNINELIKVSKVGDIEFLCYGDSATVSSNADFVKQVTNEKESCIKDTYNISSSIKFKERIDEYDSISGLFENYVEADDVCVMIYTSGSTGTPKGVLLSAYNILNSSYSMAYQMGIGYDEKICLILPLFHIFGLTGGLFCNFVYNVTIYFPDNIKTSTLLNIIDKEKCTIFHSVPTMILALMNNESFSKEKVASLKHSLLAGAATTKAQLETMHANFPNNKFQIAYGLSEMAPITMTKVDDDFEHLSNTVGCPVPYVDVVIKNISDDKLCKTGVQGEVTASGYNTFSGYYKLPLEKQAIDDSGFIRTGDLGFLDEDGYLHLTGRAKELIIRGGENIVPNEIASEISKYPDVADVKVVGIPDDFFGEVVCACIVMHGNTKFEKEKIDSFLKDKLAKYKIPAYYLNYEQFPVLGSGKVDMLKLKKDAAERCKEM